MARDPNCVFCKIVAGEIPAAVVYEDEAVFAFLDVGPLAEGHLLVIPRDHYARLAEDLPADQCALIVSKLPMLGRALREATGADGFNLLCNQGAVAGQEVPHVHFHLIPRKPGDGLGYRWNAGAYPEGRAQEVLAAYKGALARIES
jgi:histidine triad (HIT) family protein